MGEFLDTKGLACPLPVLKTRRALRNMPSGEILTVEATAAEGFGVMVFAGRPLDEPVAWRGPIVMSKQREIRIAYSDLQRGTFLKQRVPFDYRLELTTQAAPPAVAAP